MTAEYEYENMKRAVESARVVIFVRIRHNVFTSLAADCVLCQWTVQHVWAAGGVDAHVLLSLTYSTHIVLSVQMTTCH